MHSDSLVPPHICCYTSTGEEKSKRVKQDFCTQRTKGKCIYLSEETDLGYYIMSPRSLRRGKVSIIGGKSKGKGNALGCYRETSLGTQNTRANEQERRQKSQAFLHFSSTFCQPWAGFLLSHRGVMFTFPTQQPNVLRIKCNDQHKVT